MGTYMTQSTRVARYQTLVTALVLAGLTQSVAIAASETRQKWVVDFEKGCEKGVMQDCVNLAVAYARGDVSGRKIQKDPRLAKQYTDRVIETGNAACRQGNLKNCYMLGVMYFEGDLVPTDFAKGIDYARKACVGGYKESCDWLKNSGIQ